MNSINNQIELFSIEIPCVGVCAINKNGYCFRCFRSPQERQLWPKMSNEKRREVIRLINGRHMRVKNMRRRQKQQLILEFDDTVSQELF